MTDLRIEVTIPVERAAQVTHGELTITENLTKIFPNSKCVMCHCPILLESHIVLNTRFFQLRHETVLRHVQVHVLLNRTIKVVKPEEPILQLVEDCVLFPPNKAVPSWNKTNCSLIDTLVYGTSITKEDIAAFWNRANCLIPPCTCITSAILIHFVYTLNEHWKMRL